MGTRYNHLTEAVLTSTNNLCSWAEIIKKVYPCKPQFYYIKVGFKVNYIDMFLWCQIIFSHLQCDQNFHLPRYAKFLLVDNVYPIRMRGYMYVFSRCDWYPFVHEIVSRAKIFSCTKSDLWPYPLERLPEWLRLYVLRRWCDTCPKETNHRKIQ